MTVNVPDRAFREILRENGFLPLVAYGVIGDGRSVAITGADGAIDWWCVPNIDSAPLFDRLLDAPEGGYFSITPIDKFTVARRYLTNSNVLETVFKTASGVARLLESHNSGSAGRLPWAELARRIEGLSGEVRFQIEIRFSRRGGAVNPYRSNIGKHNVFHASGVLGVCLMSDGISESRNDDAGLRAEATIKAGQRETIAIVAGENEPLVVPSIADIDARLDNSDKAWRAWADGIQFDGERRPLLLRSALALKLLLFSPSGAIAAAATMSLPEGIGGEKNYDYRYAWIRDAGYTIRAFLRVGAQAEAKAAFTWLLRQLQNNETSVLYCLSGGLAPDLEEIDVPGYQNSAPVSRGNQATNQLQLGVYGDIFETAACFVQHGNLLDSHSAETLARLADACADKWRQKDSGIWELPEARHYTMSKISAWQALARAAELAEGGQLPTTCQERWQRERDRIEEWIGEHCWSESRGAYVFYPGSNRLDASLALAARFGFDGKDRLIRTLDALDRELGAEAFHYRYSGASEEEGCFLACTFWIVEARTLLGQRDLANVAFDRAIAALDRQGLGIYSEMIDPESGAYLGNLPQGLTHLAIVQAITTMHGDPD